MMQKEELTTKKLRKFGGTSIKIRGEGFPTEATFASIIDNRIEERKMEAHSFLDPHESRVVLADDFEFSSGQSWVESTKIQNQNGLIQSLLERVSDLEIQLESFNESPFLTEKVDISGEAAIEQVKSFFVANHGKNFSPDEIAEALGFSISRTNEICKLLALEGQIEST